MVGPVIPARPRTQDSYHHDTKVEPDAATAVIELLMMGGRTPETCWAVNERRDSGLENCCIWLVIYLNCAMMYGLSNLKFSLLILSSVHILVTVCSLLLYSTDLELHFIVHGPLWLNIYTHTNTHEKYTNQPTTTTQLSQLLNVSKYYLSQPYMAIIYYLYL